MKKISIIVFILLLAVYPMAAAADEDNHNISVDQVLTEIMQAQDISSPGSIDCEAVSDEELERLGEAVMSVMHPDPKQHELMDRMMARLRQDYGGQGGEGSGQLRGVHINMGQNYLNCGSEGSGMMMGGFSPKVGAGFNSSIEKAGDSGRYSMMGLPFMGAGLGSGGWVFMILFWVLVILGIVWLIKSLFAKNSGQGNVPDALEILKARYAKGEITNEEFEKMKKDLT